MNLAACLAVVLVCAACGAAPPESLGPRGPVETPAGADDGIPITVVNGDDVVAEVEVTLYNALTGAEETTLERSDLHPGASRLVILEPTRGRDDAFHLKINGFVATSSDFAGCTPDDLEPPLPRSLVITVLPNGEPRACPWVEGPE